MKQKEAWRLLASVFTYVHKAWGICCVLGTFQHHKVISGKTYGEMRRRIDRAVVASGRYDGLLFPLTAEGRQQRVAFCRTQAKKVR